MPRRWFRPLDAFQDSAVRTTANALRGKKTGAVYLFDLKLMAGFFEPVDDQVGLGFDTVFIESEEVIGVLVAQFAAEEFAAEEGWFADDVFGLGPGGFVGFALIVVAEDGVCVLDVGEDLEEWFLVVLDGVVVLPLEEADPDDDGGDLMGVEVGFYAEELAGVGDGVEGDG